MQNENAVGHFQHLFEFCRYENACKPLGGLLPYDVKDLALGLHVDAAARFIEEHDGGTGIEPFANHHFLLIAAGQ